MAPILGTNPSVSGQNNVDPTQNALYVYAVNAVYAASQVRPLQTPPNFSVVNSAALANAASASIIAAPGAGFGIWLYTLSVATSIAGRYNIQIGGVDWQVYLALANTTYVVPISSIGMILGSNAALTIVNNSGSASNVITSPTWLGVLL